jgi:hypothetical protein
MPFLDNNDLFSEGNVFILHKSVMDFIFKDKLNLFYNILNFDNSFDYNWVKINYNLNTNIFDTFKNYTDNNLFGNVFTSKNEFRDGMIEHMFERIWINIIKKINGNYLVLNQDNIFDNFNIKLNAIYFPQFHEIPENNKFWGDGFTEWTLLKPFQEKIIINNKKYDIIKPNDSIGYYDLNNINVIEKQIQLAEKYNINGFIIYHYWFENNQKILYKPLEYFLKEDVKFPFCISWANETWSKKWDGIENEILLKQTYGNKQDYLLHIQYLIPFFKKENYLKNNKGECIFYVYNFFEIENIFNDMMDVWNKELDKYLLKIQIIITENSFKQNHNLDDFNLTKFIFEPMYSTNYVEMDYTFVKNENQLIESIEFDNFDFEYYKKHNIDVFEAFNNNLNEVFYHFKNTGYKENRLFRLKNEINYYSCKYNEIINKYKNSLYQVNNKHLGLPLTWNNRVRRNNIPFFYIDDVNKENIEYLFYILICRIILKYVNNSSIEKKDIESNFININAWNEWNEQAVLEPNNINGYENLELIYKINNNL